MTHGKRKKPLDFVVITLGLGMVRWVKSWITRYVTRRLLNSKNLAGLQLSLKSVDLLEVAQT